MILPPILTRTTTAEGKALITKSLPSEIEESKLLVQHKMTSDRNAIAKYNDALANLNKAQSKQSNRDVETKEEEMYHSNNNMYYQDNNFQPKELYIEHPSQSTEITYSDIIQGIWQPVNVSLRLHKSTNPPADLKWCKHYTQELEKKGNQNIIHFNP